MAKKKAKEEIQSVVLKDLVEVIKACDRSKPFTFKRDEFSKSSVSLALIRGGTSKIEYHANGEITLHWKA